MHSLLSRQACSRAWPAGRWLSLAPRPSLHPAARRASFVPRASSDNGEPKPPLKSDDKWVHASVRYYLDALRSSYGLLWSQASVDYPSKASGDSSRWSMRRPRSRCQAPAR